MTESVVCFGPQDALVGILSVPSDAARRRPAVVMWNVGTHHRVGPSRSWVELSRRLALHDIAALRFDIGGLGDSAPRESPGNDEERAVLDVFDALGALEKRGFDRFIFISNCSGTDASHQVATRDARVIAAAYLDGYTYQTPRSTLLRRVGVYFSYRRWHRWLRTTYPQYFTKESGERTVGARDEIFQREYPPRASFESDLSQMVDRGVKFLFVYSGESNYWYDGQFYDWLERKDWKDQIEILFSPEAGHVYPELGTRVRMLGRLERFVCAVAGVELP